MSGMRPYGVTHCNKCGRALAYYTPVNAYTNYDIPDLPHTVRGPLCRSCVTRHNPVYSRSYDSYPYHFINGMPYIDGDTSVFPNAIHQGNELVLTEPPKGDYRGVRVQVWRAEES